MNHAEINWAKIVAIAVIIMIFQKYVVKGLTMGAVKG